MGLRAILAALFALAGPAGAEVLRLATWSPELTRRGPGLLLRDIERGDAQIEAAIRVIAATDADVLLLTGFDWDHDGLAITAFAARLADAGAPYAHIHASQPNSGLRTGLDMDGDGRLGRGEDAQGYGGFTGVRGMAVLSRRPLAVRDLTATLWRELPGHIMPETAPEVAAIQRLPSVAHWDVSVQAGSGALHLLTLSATPPLFDGPEDRNGRRNHDELALWLTEAPADRWVLMGKINIDPEIGEGRREALRAMLALTTDPAPRSPAGQMFTADWGPDRDGNPRKQRVDYILPSRDLRVIDAGIVWPDTGDLARDAAVASRHRLVWMDIDVP